MSLISLHENEIVIFTDGAARGNPGPGGYGAIAIYPNAYGEPMVDEIGGRESLTTNNRMELKAVIEAIKNFIDYYQNLSDYSFVFYIDSGYVVNGITKWLAGWKRNGWVSSTKEPVKNRDLWEELDNLLRNGDGHARSANKGIGKIKPADLPRVGGHTKIGVRKIAPSNALSIKLNLIEGHAGVWGNERCDVIATSFADNKPVKLFTGSLVEYSKNEDVSDGALTDARGGENVLNIRAVHQARKDAQKARKSASSNRGVNADGTKGAAYSYVSMVNGDIHTDKTWAECEKRVKGKKGARFRKVFSLEEEVNLIKEFGSAGK